MIFNHDGSHCECSNDCSAIEDRRQRAREALYDARAAIRQLPAEHDPVEMAIEVATQVKITHDVFSAAWDRFDGPIEQLQDIITAAFRAAGFEVVE